MTVSKLEMDHPIVSLFEQNKDRFYQWEPEKISEFGFERVVRPRDVLITENILFLSLTYYKYISRIYQSLE